MKMFGRAIALALTGVSASAMAQTAAVADDAAGLQEIIVTATKRSENLQNVPVAVSAISSAALQNAGVFETSDLSHAMPNLQVSSPYGSQQPNFSLRGIGVGSEYNANAASPVGIYVDEVYQAFRSSHGQQLYDLEQIEVVRGPQGTLYGRNTTGGAINFITRKPKLQGANGQATIGYGNFNRVNAEAALEVTPVDDVLGLRVAGTYVNSDPYIRNAFPAGQVTGLIAGKPLLSTGRDPGGTESWGIRGAIRFRPSDTVDLMLKGYAARAEGGLEVPIATGSSKSSDLIFRPTTLLNSFLPAFATHYVAGTGNTVTLADAFNGTPGAAAYSSNANGFGDRDINSDSAGRALTTARGVVLSADVVLTDDLRVKSISGYDAGVYSQLGNTDCDASFLRLCSIGYKSRFNAFNQDLRFDYASGPIKLIFGAYYGRDKIVSNNNPDFFNALSLFNRAGGITPSYFNPAGIFSNGNAALDFSSLLNPGNNGGVPPMPTGVYATQHYSQMRNSIAFYGEGSYEIAPTLKATLGLRYTTDRNKFRDGLTTYFNDAGAAALYTVSDYKAGGKEAFYYILPLINEAGAVVSPASTGPAPGGLRRDGKSSRVSGRFILDWKPIDHVLLYASYSRGYRAGTFNGLAYQRAAQVYFVPPESVNAFEGGIKSRFLDNRLQLNAAFFYYDYTGQQGQVVDATATANLVALDGTMKGLELELQYAATDRLLFGASLGVLDSRYKHGDCSKPFVGQQNGNCVLSGAGPTDVGGNPFPFAAKTSANISIDWTPVDTGDDKILLHGDLSYTGNFHYDAFGDYSRVPLFKLTVPIGGVSAVPLVAGRFTRGGGDFWQANARLTYTHKQYAIAAWVKNITDRTTYPYGIATENLFGNDYRVRNQPRTYGIEAKVSF